MKKLFVSLWFAFLVTLSLTAPVSAQTIEETNGELISERITNLDNGGYILYQLHENNLPTRTRSTIYNTSSVLDIKMCNGDGSVIWAYSLTGYYTVNSGVSSVCYNATYSQYIKDSSWSFSNGSTSYSDNKAYGKGTYKDKVLFVTVKTVTIDMWLGCDVNGNFYY